MSLPQSIISHFSKYSCHGYGMVKCENILLILNIIYIPIHSN